MVYNELRNGILVMLRRPGTTHDSKSSTSTARHGHQASLADGLDFVNTLEYSKGLPHDI